MSLTAIDRAINVATAVPAVQPVVAPAAQRAPEVMLKGTAVPGVAQADTLDTASLEKAAARMEEYARSAGRSLQFRVDQDSGRVVVSVRDLSTGELIRQIPSEAALRIAQDLGSGEPGASSLIIDGLA
ncbi:MAG: flagellar protein FlaG [Steroidobacteraceae bacterium]|jgi:flagellar protein FlaG|nr:flagellar protein FlaG [Steroidobacteraceae bacterium]